MIRLSGIRKNYRDGENRLNPVLRGVELEVEKGAFVAIKGPSGSGKTTLLSIVGTLIRPDEGTYRLDGVEMTAGGIDLSVVRNTQIGFVFQDHRLLPQFTALENILLPALAYADRPSPETLAYARRLMELTQITGVAAQYPHTLSGGEASRVAVCRALVMRPLLLLADEPTGQLDSEHARRIASLLQEMNGQLHTTILMVTHSDETSAFAQRVLALKEGMLR